MTAATPIARVVIADDHPPTRAGVRAALEDGGFEVCAEVGDAASAIEAAIRERPDICLLDVHMPGDGIAAASRITAALPDVAIVMLTVARDDTHLFEALRAGALGYLLKDTDPDRLPLALQGVLNGEAALPRSLVARVIDEFQQRGRKRIPLVHERAAHLTSREWEVLQLLRDGLTTAQIAERLYVAPGTVRTHVATVLRKLRVPDRAAAVKLVEER